MRIAAIDAANDTLSITSFYLPTRRLMKAVVKAAKRGVRVEVFHSHREALPSTDLAWIAAAAGFGRLLKAGVTIYENLHGEHSKIVLIDDKWVAFGSYNFEDAAHDRLAESMLVSSDERALRPARAILLNCAQMPIICRYARRGFATCLWRSAYVFYVNRFKRWLREINNANSTERCVKMVFSR
ncbi:MAG: phospholipase D family protein [Turneriella sp.]